MTECRQTLTCLLVGNGKRYRVSCCHQINQQDGGEGSITRRHEDGDQITIAGLLIIINVWWLQIFF